MDRVDCARTREEECSSCASLKTAVWSGFQEVKSPKPALDLPVLALLTKNIEKKP